MTDPAAPDSSSSGKDYRKGLFADYSTFHGSVIGYQVNINASSALQPMPIAEAQALLDRLPLDDIPAPQTLPTPHRMPLASNPLFVGRAEDFRALAGLLKAGGTAVITTGIGGMGKTQLAVEIAHRYGAYFAGGVFWISCADPAGISTEVVRCGETMGLPLADLDLPAQVRRIWAEWETDVPRLLILDNCEDEVTLRAWKPSTGGCRVLVTSRRAQWDATLRVQARPLGLLPPGESVALLQKHRADLSEPEAEQIAEELGRLPLALHLAGSFLTKYKTITPAAYLAKLRSPDLLDHPSLQGRGVASMPTEREPNVARAFALSFERLNPYDTTDILARQLLARAACFAPGEPFPRALLVATVELEGDEETRELILTDALERLIGLGLLEREDQDQLRLHRLIVAYSLSALKDDDALPAVERVVNRVASWANKTGVPQAMLPVLAHLRHLVRQAQQEGREDVQTDRLLTNLGTYLDLVGSYAEARPFYEQSLAICERLMGTDHPDTATSLHNLAFLLKAQGSYEAARPLLERALAIRERVLGADHPDTAGSLNNLAELHRAQGAYEAARPLYERALAIAERVLGADHPDTATSLNNLAGLLEAQGAYEAAQPLYERALGIREQVLGADHPDTAGSLNNLAGLFYVLGAYDAARPLLERALAISERVLGGDHPQTAGSLNNLAGLLSAQGAYEAARSLYERALAIYERVLGADHPLTAQSLTNLAMFHANQGQFALALPLLERAIRIRQARLGPQHPDTVRSQQSFVAMRRDGPAHRTCPTFGKKYFGIPPPKGAGFQG